MPAVSFGQETEPALRARLAVSRKKSTVASAAPTTVTDTSTRPWSARRSHPSASFYPRALARQECTLQQRHILEQPAMGRGVVDLHTPLPHRLPLQNRRKKTSRSYQPEFYNRTGNFELGGTRGD